AAEGTVLDEHVRQAGVGMDQHVAVARTAEWTAGGVDGVDVSKDLARPACNKRRLPAKGRVVKRHTRDRARHQPIVAERLEQAQHLGGRQPTRHPHRAVPLVLEVARTLHVYDPRLALQAPYRAGPAPPGDLL